MKVDTAIIGGGLSALVCGIRLQRSGRNTVILSAGQNSLFFFSGAFGVLSRLPDGTAVDMPFEAAGALPPAHPYSKIGQERLKGYASEFKQFFRSCGIELNGCEERNMWRYLATGTTKASWASLKDTELFQGRQMLKERKVMIVNIPGFLDHFPQFISRSLTETGNICRVADISTPGTEVLRNTSSVVRSLSLAKVFEQDEALDAFIKEVRNSLQDEDTVILPQVFGLRSEDPLSFIKEAIPAKVMYIGTMTPSVPGNRFFAQLKSAYENAGGCILSGNVRSASFDSGLVSSLNVDGIEDTVEADDFVLATGSFVSKGLVSSPDSISEPVFGLDVESSADRSEWYSADASARQNYIGYGVRTDDRFHPSIRGKIMENLYAAGSVLAGANSLHEGSGAGTAIFSAMRVSDLILGE